MVSNKELGEAFLEFLNILRIYLKETISVSLIKIDSMLPNNFDYYLAFKVLLFILLLILLTVYAVYAIIKEKKRRSLEMMFKVMEEEKRKNSIKMENKKKEQSDWSDISLS